MARQTSSAQSRLAAIRSATRFKAGIGEGSITIHGIEDLQRELSILPTKIAKTLLTRGLYKGGEIVRDRAKVLAPLGATGDLKESITLRRRQMPGITLTAAVDVFAKRSKSTKGGYYAHLVELGHNIYRTTRTGKYFIKHYKGQRFMKPAIEQKREEVIRIVGSEVEMGLEKFYAGKKRV